MILKRTPGLDSVGSDAELVLKCKKQILEDLRDPYFKEALLEILREHPQLVTDTSRKQERGARARRWQGIPDSAGRSPGRPKNAKATRANAKLVEIVGLVISLGKAKNVAAAVRLIVDKSYPKDSQAKRDQKAKQIYQAVKYAQRNLINAR